MVSQQHTPLATNAPVELPNQQQVSFIMSTEQPRERKFSVAKSSETGKAPQYITPLLFHTVPFELKLTPHPFREQLQSPPPVPRSPCRYHHRLSQRTTYE